MKKTFTFLSALLFAHCLMAQTYFVNEDFNSGIPGPWTVITAGCGHWWEGTNGGYQGNYLDGTEFAFIISDSAVFCQFDDELITPVFDATGASQVFLEFDHYFRFMNFDVAYVEVFDGAIWNIVATYTGQDFGAWNAPDQPLIDISAYIDVNMQVRFRYTANWDWWWAVDNVKIYKPTAYNLNIASTGVLCNGDCNGQASVAPTGGTPPYTYLWGNNATTPSITGLCAGTYFVTVIDAVPDTVIGSVVVSEPAPIVHNSSTTVDPSCNGGSDGSAISNPSGGTPGYTYLWDANAGNQTTQTATGLAIGTFCVTVTDANGCTSDTCLIVTQPSVVTASVTPTTDASCNGSSDGDATANGAGGTPGYTYLWDANAGNQTTQTATGLAAGTYSVTVTDNNGCTAVNNTTINQPTAISATFATTASALGDCTGDATVTPSGGTPGYTYQWDANAGNQVTQTADSLCTGQYCVTITDNNGCTFDTCVTVAVIGINEHGNSNAISIYPNPNNGEFVVEFDTKEAIEIGIRIINVLGEEVFSDELKQTYSTYRRKIDLKGFSKGIYMLQLTSEKGNINSRIIIK